MLWPENTRKTRESNFQPAQPHRAVLGDAHHLSQKIARIAQADTADPSFKGAADPQERFERQLWCRQ